MSIPPVLFGSPKPSRATSPLRTESPATKLSPLSLSQSSRRDTLSKNASSTTNNSSAHQPSPQVLAHQNMMAKQEMATASLRDFYQAMED
jgi:hypothetical protein